MTIEEMREIESIRNAVDYRCSDLLYAARQHSQGKLDCLNFQIAVEELVFKLIEAVHTYEEP